MKPNPKNIFDPKTYKDYAYVPPNESIDPGAAILQPPAQVSSEKAAALAMVSRMRLQVEANHVPQSKKVGDDYQIPRVRVENVHKGDPGLTSSDDED